MDYVSAIALTTQEEGLAYLKREAPPEDLPHLVRALNEAAGMLERLTGRKLAFRTYRDAVSLGTGTATANSKEITGLADTSTAEVGDLALGSKLRAGSRIESIDSAAALTLSAPASAAGTFTLTVGTEPELHDGVAHDAWVGSDTWPLYARETPVVEVFAVTELASDDSERTLDLTGIRIERESGAIYLPNDYLCRGGATVELHYSAGYRAPSGTVAGDPADYFALQLATHRLAQAYFQDQKNAVGRVADRQLGNASFRFVDFEIPADVLGIIQAYRRRG